MLKGKELSAEIIARKRLNHYASLEEIVKKVSEAFGEKNKKEDIGLGARKSNPMRNVAIYLAQRYTGMGNEEIGRHFGGLHYSAVSKAAASVKRVMAEDMELKRIVMRIDSHFKA